MTVPSPEKLIFNRGISPSRISQMPSKSMPILLVNLIVMTLTPAPLCLTPVLSEVIIKILRVEVGVCQARVKVQVLVPVVFDETAVPVIDSDP